MGRFYLPSVQSGKCGDVVPLPMDLHRHLLVLRLKLNEVIEVFANPQHAFSAKLIALDKKSSLIQLQEHLRTQAELPYHLSLVQGLPEGKKMDWIIEKSVELGVTDIYPIQTDRAVVKLSTKISDERAQNKIAHWQAIAVAASEQSGRALVPKVHPIEDLKTWMTQHGNRTAQSLSAILALHPHTPQSLTRYLKTSAVQDCAILIGPEGGWSPNEYQLLQQSQHTQLLNMGPRVLRTETAGIVALAQIQALWNVENVENFENIAEVSKD